MRRIVKPFAVEIRRSGRRSKIETPGPVAFTPERHDAEQPWLTAWPGLDQEAQPWPSLPEPVTPVAAQSGRILPVLDDPETLPLREPSRAEPKRKGRPHKSRDRQVETGDEPDVMPSLTDPLSEPVPMDLDGPSAASAPMLRKGRIRMPRSEFRRGERWRARLPAGAHRASKHT